jgi:hypothetical protein
VTYSQANANAVALLGITAERMTSRWNQSFVYAMDFTLADFGILTNANPDCYKTGSATSSVTKAGVYKGLAAGDQVTISFSKCPLLFGSFTLDGVVKLTARSQVSLTQTYAYDISYEVETTGLSYTDSAGQYQFSGVLDVDTHRATIDVTRKLSVPAGQSFSATINADAKTTVLAYAAGASFEQALKDYSDLGQEATYKLDGAISIGDGQSAAIPLTMATPTPLDLVVFHNGAKIISIEPISGVVNTRWGDPVLATSATVNGANLTISADSDGNGSLDLVSNTTWAALVPN